MKKSTADTAQWVNRCRQGDSDAFGVLVRRFQNAGYAVALGMLRDPQEAEDLLQDAFITAYCKLGQLRQAEAFAGWFHSIVVAHCHKRLRRGAAQRRQTTALATVTESADRPKGSASTLAQRRLWQCVFSLPEPARSAALLHYLSGFSQRETAAFLQVPPSTVNGRLQQARKLLRRALGPLETEEHSMNRIDISAELVEEVYQTASLPLAARLDMADSQNAVLYCGVNADLVIEAAPADELIIEGTSVSLGLSKKEAQESARGSRIHCDRVDDFFESGPHPGEVFDGTSTGPDGPQTCTAGTQDLWAAYIRARGEGGNGLLPADLFPEIGSGFAPLPPNFRSGLQAAGRISLVQEKAQALVMPPDAYRPRLHQIFRPNATDPGWVHGSVGYVSLNVQVPAGRTLTVVRADQVAIRNVGASVHLLQCRAADIEGLEGDLCLLDTPASRISRVRGQVLQRHYSFGGMNWQDESAQAARSGRPHCRIENIEGEIDLEVGCMDFEIGRLQGTARVVNRYGDTRLHARSWPAEAHCTLHTHSGAVTLLVDDAFLADRDLSILTLCGAIAYPAYRDADKGTFNSTQLAAFSTVPPTGRPWKEALKAHIVVQTESGNVAVEKAG